MPCLICKKYDLPLDKINEENCSNSSTAKDDLIELFGDQIKYYIAHDSSICNNCKNILKNAAKLKSFIWKLMTYPSGYNTANMMRNYLSKFADDDYSDEDLEMSDERTPTPKLLTRALTEPYNEDLEERLAERERMRSLSRSNSYYGIEEYPKKKKRRKGFRLTYRKGSSVKSPSARSRSSRSRSISRMSVSSTSTGVTTKSVGRPTRSVSSKLSTQSMFTRSLARELVEEGRLNDYSYHCTIDSCDVGYNDMDFMDQHNVYEHQMRRLHFCTECNLAYTTAPLLKDHENKHYTTYFFCFYCGEKQYGANVLQAHLVKHSEYSVDCKYCDKSFLSITSRNEHTSTAHKGDTKKKKKIEKLILARIDKPNYTEKRPVVDTSYKVWYLGTHNYHHPEEENGNDSIEVTETKSSQESADQDGETATQEGPCGSPASVLSSLTTDQEVNTTTEEVTDPDYNNTIEEGPDPDCNNTIEEVTEQGSPIEDCIYPKRQ
ncbi:uncharacterized protein [Diabrotica undecimpunctata]|uniref:uncharacterized protein n=1 Tax=Diabrotica undecimpunctata TaxID=50387 RepID=UPI003B63A9F7